MKKIENYVMLIAAHIARYFE